MKTRRLSLLTPAALLLCGACQLSAGHMAPDWDLTGTYVVGYYVQLGSYAFDMTVTSEDFITGAFTATSDSGVIIFDGQVNGSAISFSASGGNCNYLSFSGTIADNGTFAGGMSADNCHGPFGGSFGSVSGHASPVAPEPQPFYLGVISIALLACLRLRQERHRNATSRIY